MRPPNGDLPVAGQGKHKLDIAQEILKVSPFTPSPGDLDQQGLGRVKDRIPAWEKESGDSPAVLAPWDGMIHAKEYDDARRILSRYIEVSPDVWAYQTLAATSRPQGKTDRWQTTLDDFLNKVEDLGLDHAKVRVEIADHYMALKQWDKARPYAEPPGRPGPDGRWIVRPGGAESEEDWERAETWYSRITERYPDNCWAVWYFFCKRTGRGNLDAARDFAEQYVAARTAGRISWTRCMPAFLLVDGRPEKAKAASPKPTRVACRPRWPYAWR